MKKLILCMFLLSFGIISKGQNSRDAMNKAIDYCNCKLAFAYCDKYASTHPGTKEAKSFSQVIEPQLNCKIEDPISFSALVDLLSHNNYLMYAQAQVPELQKLKTVKIDNFSKDIAVKTIIDSVFSNPKLAGAIALTGFQNKKDELKGELGNFFEGKFPNADTGKGKQAITVEALQSKISELENEISDNKPNFFASNWFGLILSAILSIILVLIINSRISFLSARLDRYESKPKHSNTDWHSTSSYVSSNDWARFKKGIEDNVIDINEAIRNLQNGMSTLQQKQPNKQDSNFASQNTTVSQPNFEKGNRGEVFYVSIPNKDGSFNESAFTKNINPTDSFYKLILKEPNRASFEFLNEDRAAKSAISSPELILFPVCKIKNAPDTNTKRLRTITPGIIVKRNDKWELDKPAEIEYE